MKKARGFQHGFTPLNIFFCTCLMLGLALIIMGIIERNETKQNIGAILGFLFMGYQYYHDKTCTESHPFLPED